MSLKNIGRYSTFALLLFVLGIRVEVYGQVAGGEIAKDIAANSQSLRQYTYLQTTEVILKGEVKNTRKAQVHYDSTGQKVSVPLDSAEPAPTEGRGLKARIVEKKKDEMKEYVERLVGLMGQYLPPNPDKIKAALSTAQITPPAGGNAKIAFNNYLKQGDTMALSVNSQSKKLDQISIQSSLDNDPVSFLVDFARLPDGTNYPSMTSIKSPSKGLEIKVTTSDYHK